MKIDIVIIVCVRTKYSNTNYYKKKTAIANIRQHQFVQNIGLEQKKNQLIYISVSNLSPLTTCLKYLDGFFSVNKVYERL